MSNYILKALSRFFTPKAKVYKVGDGDVSPGNSPIYPVRAHPTAQVERELKRLKKLYRRVPTKELMAAITVPPGVKPPTRKALIAALLHYHKGQLTQ